MARKWPAEPSGRVALSKPYTWAMLEWLREASSFASRSKRARRSASPATSAGSTLIATSRPSVVSVARYTSPIPPWPMRELMR